MPDASITTPTISANSKRVARNTVFLYFRMLLMMFIGLFTSRIVLKTLGVDDYGIYGAVGGIVTMFTVITNSICYTDHPSDARSAVWDYRPITRSERTSALTSRWYKLHPHELFPDYEYSLWIDGNVTVAAPDSMRGWSQ